MTEQTSDGATPRRAVKHSAEPSATGAPSAVEPEAASADGSSEAKAGAKPKKKKRAPKADGEVVVPPAPPELPPAAIERAQAAIGHRFSDPTLLVRALTHASIATVRLESNERMEFLGDAVLGLVASERIFQRFPQLLEGEMTKIKSSAVSRQTCAALARQLGLAELLVLGKGMHASGHGPGENMPQSLAAAVLESMIAAIYLDAGFDAARKFLVPLLDPLIERAAASGHQENYKSVLQQHTQQRGQPTPKYAVQDEQGPDHAKSFKIAVEIGERRFEPCWGASKKQAEQAAAMAALTELGLLIRGPGGELRVVN
jgi:ribonuclease III